MEIELELYKIARRRDGAARRGSVPETFNHKGHENARRPLKLRPSSYFVSLMVRDFEGYIVKLTRCVAAKSE
jgi:hypothetical protein